MSDTQTKDSQFAALQTVLDQMTHNREVFSAFDVTSEVRGRDQSFIVPHYKCKSYIHDVFDNNQFPADYSRELILLEFANSKHNVFVYYPHEASPYDHIFAAKDDMGRTFDKLPDAKDDMGRTFDKQTPASTDGCADYDSDICPADCPADCLERVPAANTDNSVSGSADNSVSQVAVISTKNRVFDVLTTTEGRLNVPSDLLDDIGARSGNSIEIRLGDQNKTTAYVNHDGRVRVSKKWLKKVGNSSIFKVSLSNDGSAISIDI